MSDEPLEQAPGVDTPAVENTDTQAEVNWRDRYENLQPEYTRKSQRLSALESDPTAVLEWVQQYHPDLLAGDDTEDDPGPGYEDDVEDDPRWSELQELKAWKEEQTTRQEAEQTRAEWNGWEDFVKEQAAQQDVQLSARDIKALKIDSAERNGRPVAPEKAQQILKDAIAEREAELEAEYERRRQAKRKRVPTPPGDGKTATHTADLSDDEQRIAWMTEQYNARSADS